MSHIQRIWVWAGIVTMTIEYNSLYIIDIKNISGGLRERWGDKNLI